MSFGKFYMTKDNVRSTAILAVAKANELDLDIVIKEVGAGASAEYTKLNPLNKVPSFEGSDGYVLTECLAIAIYFTSQNEKTTLLGKTKQDYASILQWMSFVNTEVLPPAIGYFLGPLGRIPFNKRAGEESLEKFYKAVDVIEKHLLINTFLVGERLTLADLFAAGLMQRAFQFILDKKWRAANPNTTRWFETVTNQPMYSDVCPEIVLCDEPIKNVPPAKPEQPKKEKAPAAATAPKAASKPKEAEADEEEEDRPAPKAKHPLESLGKPTLVLDDWKRKYSNEETREVALPWFWENFKSDEYSLWKIDYKYNDELTMTFMTSNLIGASYYSALRGRGFFARLEASRKYIFGCASVYGQPNDSIVQGAFVVRGQEALPAFDVAPDYESYEFTKLDPSKAEDHTFVDDMWAWDKPIEVKGKTYEWADGKVFK
ncbi:MAG: hypothetical protein LQ340_002900 [Diploschistes diacapsis]|nr:MAG: hypothetical protein LQ340_002900 [Diploschistes diacapsis]